MVVARGKSEPLTTPVRRGRIPRLLMVPASDHRERRQFANELKFLIPQAMAERVAKALTTHLSRLEELPVEELLAQRDRKYRQMGACTDPSAAAF